MREIKVYRWEQNPPVKVFDSYGLFHQIGCNFDEYETGPANYSTAVVEMPDGTMRNTDIEMIEFVEPLYAAFYGEENNA